MVALDQDAARGREPYAEVRVGEQSHDRGGQPLRRVRDQAVLAVARGNALQRDRRRRERHARREERQRRRGGRGGQALRLRISSVSAGMTVKRSPTTP